MSAITITAGHIKWGSKSRSSTSSPVHVNTTKKTAAKTTEEIHASTTTKLVDVSPKAIHQMILNDNQELFTKTLNLFQEACKHSAEYNCVGRIMKVYFYLEAVSIAFPEFNRTQHTCVFAGLIDHLLSKGWDIQQLPHNSCRSIVCTCKY